MAAARAIALLALFLLGCSGAGEDREQTAAHAARTKTVDAILVRAHSLIDREEYVRAAAEFGKVIALAPRDPRGHVGLGDLYTKRSLFEAAEAEYSVALSLDEDAEVLVSLGKTEMWRGRIDEAIRRFARAIEIDPEKAEPHQLLGLMLLKVERNEDALESFQRARVLDPDDVKVLHNVGYTYRLLGRIEESIEVLEEVVRKRPKSALSMFELGRAYADGSREDDARATFQRLLQVDPNHSQGREMLKRLDE